MHLKRNEMMINGKDIAEYNARLYTYSVGSTTLTKNYVNSTNCVMPMVTNTDLGTRILTVTVTFKSSDVNNKWHSVAVNKSNLDSVFVNNAPAEISLPDGFLYTAICTNISELTPDGTNCFDVTYTFNAIMHDVETIFEFSSTVSNNFFLPVNGNTATNCIIELTPTTKADITLRIKDDSYVNTIASILLKNIEANNTVIIDGKNKTVTVNGQNWMANTDLVNFPLLAPGRYAVYVYPAYSSVPIRTKITYCPTYV